MSIQCQGHFWTLAKGHLYMIFKTGFSQKPLGHFNQFLSISFQVHDNEILFTLCGSHYQDMAAMHIYNSIVKTLQKSTSPEPVN